MLAGDRDAAAVVLRCIDQRMRLLALDRPAVATAESGRTIFDLPAGIATEKSTAS